MTNNQTLRSFTNELPAPEVIWEHALETLKDDPDYNTVTNLLKTDDYNYEMYLMEDGAGAEATIVIRVRDSKIDSMLLYAFDHESQLTANIQDEEGAMRQPALNGLPEIFAPAMQEGSKLFWEYDGYPATYKTIFATAAVWFVDGEWKWARDLGSAYDYDGAPIREEDMVKQFRSVFKGFFS